MGWFGLGGGDGSLQQSDRMTGNIGDGVPQPVCLPLLFRANVSAVRGRHDLCACSACCVLSRRGACVRGQILRPCRMCEGWLIGGCAAAMTDHADGPAQGQSAQAAGVAVPERPGREDHEQVLPAVLRGRQS
jgi:hypothetical protein